MRYLKNNKKHNFIVIAFILLIIVIIFTVLSISKRPNKAANKQVGIHQKNEQPQAVKSLKINHVYWDAYEDAYIKLLDEYNYVAIKFYGNPRGAFNDGELYPTYFYNGQYEKSGKNYIFKNEVHNYIEIYFMDMKRWKRQQYSDISGPKDITIHDNIMLSFKDGKYAAVEHDNNGKVVGYYPIENYKNKIRGINNSTFPNNAQEFLSNFTYISEKEVNKLYLKGK